MNNKINVPTGIDDFKTLIDGNYLYIDKTLFLKEIIDEWGKPCLFPRPRRFGKSLNMSMIYYYFRNDFDSKYLFKGLNITKLGNDYLKEMNKYPTIFLSLKDLKKDTYSEFINKYKTIMSNLYKEHKYVLENPDIDEKFYNRIIKMEEESELADALSYLVEYLNKYYNEQVIVLLDEYDTPILHGYEKGYYREIIDFMRQLFVTTFKPNPVNPPVKKGIITGISRISKENLFSDGNNINVYSITDERYSNYFGFTEEEVNNLLKEYNLDDNKDMVKEWYDGYLFGNTTIYNPVSILTYLEKKKFDSYWTNTGGVGLLKNLIYNAKDKTNLLTEFESLIDKGYKEHVNIDLNMDLKSLNGEPNTVWTLFMLNGYLTPASVDEDFENMTLKIPNLEVKKNLIKMATSWFTQDFKGNTMVSYLINGTIDDFRNDLESVVLETFSYLDVPGTSASEAFYHAFAMGLLRVDNDYCEVTSNRESGFGRYDIILKPKINNIPAYIIEFKLVRDDSNFEKTIKKAFKQIEEMKYEVSLKDYDKVIKMAIAFKGKKLRLETR